MNTPKVTVGMPTFNRAAELKQAIGYILNQSFTDFEFIICNDGSTDNTVEVVHSFNDPRIVFLDKENKGIPFPLNSILDEAKGEYIIILHDHDIFDSQLIEKSVKALDENVGAGFVLQGSAWINEEENAGYKEMLLDLPSINDGKSFARKMYLSNGFSSQIHACCMVKKSAYEKVGKYYDKNFGFYSDIDLWLRLMANYSFVYINEPIITFKTREVTGHVMHNRSLFINDWLFNTFNKNMPAFFANGQVENIDKQNKTKWNKEVTNSLLVYSVKNKEDYIKTYFTEKKESIELLNTKNKTIVTMALHHPAIYSVWKQGLKLAYKVFKKL